MQTQVNQLKKIAKVSNKETSRKVNVCVNRDLTIDICTFLRTHDRYDNRNILMDRSKKGDKYFTPKLSDINFGDKKNAI